MKKLTCILIVAMLILCGCQNNTANDKGTSDDPDNVGVVSDEDISDKKEYTDEFGYPLPGDENYEKWYDSKLEKVVSALEEVDFIYAKILSVESTDDGQVRVVVKASDDSHINDRKNYSFVIRDNTYLMHNSSEITADKLLVGQKVLISFAYAYEDNLEYSGGEHAVAVFSLYVLDANLLNPDPLVSADFSNYETDNVIIADEYYDDEALE